MKPFQQCPGCNSKLFNNINHNEAWYEQQCYYFYECPISFCQFFDKSFKDTELKYISFHTKLFNIYVYYKKMMSISEDVSHIYSRATLEKYGNISPTLVLPAHRIDVLQWKELDTKLNLLLTFS